MEFEEIGVTATQGGLTQPQRRFAEAYLNSRRISVFRHGGCVGGDEELHYIFRAVKGFLVPVQVHRGDTPEKWAYFHEPAEASTLFLHPRPNLVRNRDIVDLVAELLGFPGEYKEQLRSGTWATLRYARKIGRKFTIVYPDGSHSADFPT